MFSVRLRFCDKPVEIGGQTIGPVFRAIVDVARGLER